jgi:hypothetical protein
MGRKTKQAKPQYAASNGIAPLTLAFIVTAVFAAFTLLPRVRATNAMLLSFVGAVVVLLALVAILRFRVKHAHRVLQYEVNARPVHYVQLLMHSSIYAYWGWYWRPVYHFVPMIVAQLAFAYALDMLVCWFRRDKWILGFGPFPIILSTNLFLWFKDDYFFLQFALVTVGILGKEFLTWTRDGRRTHIFNPSALSLSVFSLAMILTSNTAMSWGTQIASTQQRPPYIYVEIFLLGLVVQSLFRVTLVTLSSAATLYLMNLLFTNHTGSYMFIDSNIPAAVFLGMHLLVTDPATSPRTNFGKVLFGVAYGAGVFGLYWWFDLISIPTYYDKLLPVPVLNLCVPMIDKACRAIEQKLPRFDLAGRSWSPRAANLAHMSVWIALCAVMFGTRFLGIGGGHPGSQIAFWEQACSEDRYNTCRVLTNVLTLSCSTRDARSCLKLAAHLDTPRGGRDEAAALRGLGDACELGERDGCTQLGNRIARGGRTTLESSCEAGHSESCELLGLIYRYGIGVPRDPARGLPLLAKACDTGDSRACGQLGETFAFGQGAGVDNTRAIGYFEHACRGDYAPSCFNAGMMYSRGIGVERQLTVATERFRAACDLGFDRGCEAVAP